MGQWIGFVGLGLFLLAGLLCGLGLAPIRASELAVMEPGAPDCGVGWPYQHLVGNFHNHTIPKIDDHELVHGYVKETERARAMGLEAFGISDHDGDLSRDLWLAQRAFARSQSQAQPPFVVVAGFEWTIGSLVPDKDQLVTHINGFGCPQLIRANGGQVQPGDLLATNLEVFYRQAAQLSRLGEVVFQFNHPWAGTDHFGSFARPKNFAVVRSVFAMLEVDSGLTDSLRFGLQWFQRALQEGWLVAPTINNDTAGGTTRLNFNRSTGVWVDPRILSLDPQRALAQALRARRCYARHANALLQFGVRTGGQFVAMGGQLPVTTDGLITVEFLAQTEIKFRNPRVALYLVRPGTVDRQALHLATLPTPLAEVGGHTQVRVPSDTVCVYLCLEDSSGVMISAPVWLLWPTTTQLTAPPPATTNDQLRFVVAPGHSLRLAVSAYASWHQMFVIRRDGVVVKTTILTNPSQREEYRFTNHGHVAIICTFEPYHRPSQHGDWQATRLMMVAYDSQPSLLLFEDGDDRDYDDLIIEVYRE